MWPPPAPCLTPLRSLVDFITFSYEIVLQSTFPYCSQDHANIYFLSQALLYCSAQELKYLKYLYYF